MTFNIGAERTMENWSLPFPTCLQLADSIKLIDNKQKKKYKTPRTKKLTKSAAQTMENRSLPLPTCLQLASFILYKLAKLITSTITIAIKITLQKYPYATSGYPTSSQYLRDRDVLYIFAVADLL